MNVIITRACMTEQYLLWSNLCLLDVKKFIALHKLKYSI